MTTRTDQETQVIALRAQGMSTYRIAQRIGVSADRVEIILDRIAAEAAPLREVPRALSINPTTVIAATRVGETPLIPQPRPARPRAACGTHAAWTAHTRRGETPCTACRTARNEYQRERKNARRAAQGLPPVKRRGTGGTP